MCSTVFLEHLELAVTAALEQRFVAGGANFLVVTETCKQLGTRTLKLNRNADTNHAPAMREQAQRSY